MLIDQFLCRTDNIAILLHDEASRKTIAIDAPDGAAIAARLDAAGRQLEMILITHHHLDHVEGIHYLKEKTGARIFGPDAEKTKIPDLDGFIKDGDTIDCHFCEVRVMATPGHTAGGVSYHIPREKYVFTGDTLFSLGCGRLFEGTPAMMFSSLQKLDRLPGDTQIYCGHEYTESNGYFAQVIDPHNSALQQRMQDVIAARRCGKLTLPSTLALERATNPFLRCGNPDIRKNIGLADTDDETVFTELRKRKDQF